MRLYCEICDDDVGIEISKEDVEALMDKHGVITASIRCEKCVDLP